MSLFILSVYCFSCALKLAGKRDCGWVCISLLFFTEFLNGCFAVTPWLWGTCFDHFPASQVHFGALTKCLRMEVECIFFHFV